MKLYLAAAYTSNFGKSGTIYNKLTDAEKWHRCNHPYILESYHYIHKQRYVDLIRQEGQKIFLDSGAFSAFTKGVDIDIPTYCEYVKENWDIIERVQDRECDAFLFSVLDKISLTDRNESAQGTWRNQMEMERLGVRPLPCFHYGEPEEALQWYVDRYKYITLGGMVPITTPQLYYWLDRIWDKYLTNSDGSPKIKVHGFGLTTVDLMERYPWYSVDSSSWVQIAVHGNILIPEYGSIAISSDSPRTKEQYYHYDTLPPVMQESILQVVKSQGFEVDRLKSSAYSRWCFNFWAFRQINERTNKANKKFKPEQMGLF